MAIALSSKLGFHGNCFHRAARRRSPISGPLGAGELSRGRSWRAQEYPLGRERWAGAVDTRRKLHAGLPARIYQSMAASVAACGLAQGMDSPTSVAPFILRAVHLIGILFRDGAERETP